MLVGNGIATWFPPSVDSIAQSVTGRCVSYFSGDLTANYLRIKHVVAGRRILVSGGAGSIGSATILELLELDPAAIAVLDTNENNLAELVRNVRSSKNPFRGDFSVQPLDYGSRMAEGWMALQAPFDLVLSFAALKHVRSERDEFSLCRMLEVNLLKGDRFLAACRRHGHGNSGVFFVSTDKAANPVSLMGASKRAMELLLWAHSTTGCPASLLEGGEAPALPRITTTRFANVAFSDGSLPWGFLQRLQKGQPLAAPGDIRRYLVSPKEAGQLCLLATVVCPHRHVLVPCLNPNRDLVTFTAIAEHTLKAFKLEPDWHQSADTARISVGCRPGHWPVLVTTSDTSGEKEIEEFIGDDEQVADIGLSSVQAIPAGSADLLAFGEFLRVLDAACTSGRPPSKEELVRTLGAVVPGFNHKDSGRSLDSKM